MKRGFPAWAWGILSAAAALSFVLACGSGVWMLRHSQAAVLPAIVPTPTVPDYGTPLPSQTPVASPSLGGSARPVMEANTDRQVIEIDGIPLPPGSDPQAVIASSGGFSYLARQPFERVVAFYQEQMPLYAWELSSTAWRLTPKMTEMIYSRDDRFIRLIITNLPFVGAMIVLENQ